MYYEKTDSVEALQRRGGLETENDRMKRKMLCAADILADAGVIHNTPHAKAQWAKGK